MIVKYRIIKDYFNKSNNYILFVLSFTEFPIGFARELLWLWSKSCWSQVKLMLKRTVNRYILLFLRSLLKE